MRRRSRNSNFLVFGVSIIIHYYNDQLLVDVINHHELTTLFPPSHSFSHLQLGQLSELVPDISTCTSFKLNYVDLTSS